MNGLSIWVFMGATHNGESEEGSQADYRGSFASAPRPQGRKTHPTGRSTLAQRAGRRQEEREGEKETLSGDGTHRPTSAAIERATRYCSVANTSTTTAAAMSRPRPAGASWPSRRGANRQTAWPTGTSAGRVPVPPLGGILRGWRAARGVSANGDI